MKYLNDQRKTNENTHTTREKNKGYVLQIEKYRVNEYTLLHVTLDNFCSYPSHFRNNKASLGSTGPTIKKQCHIIASRMSDRR